LSEDQKRQPGPEQGGHPRPAADAKRGASQDDDGGRAPSEANTPAEIASEEEVEREEATYSPERNRLREVFLLFAALWRLIRGEDGRGRKVRWLVGLLRPYRGKVILTSIALVAATGGLVLLLARRLGASPTVAGMSLVLLVAPLLTVYFSARPQLIDYVAVLALVLLLRGIVEAQASMWSLVALGGLTIGWVNLHAGALLGVAIVGATTVVVFARRSTRNRSGWCLAALVTVTACTLVNPYGIGIVSQTMQVKQASEGVVTEWQHLDPANPMQLITFAAGLIALVVAARRRDVVFTAALAVAAAGAVTAIRILPVLLLLSAPMLAVYASQPPVLRYLRSRRTMLAQGSALGLAVIVVLAGLALSHAGRADPSDYPGAVVHAIPKHCRVFNSYLIGGYVILERPDVAVSLDSRNDLYGAQRVLLAQRVLAGQGDPDHELAGAGCVLVPPTSGLAHRLAGRDGWTLKAAETGAALYVRN